MLSYQHIYHAGCLADVHKHAALAVVLAAMVEKDKSLYYMETHAGRGLYDLASSESQKTGEAARGILAMQEKLPKDHPYIETLKTIQKNYGKSFYPGSPMIAHNILRPEDRLFLMELHKQEFAALKGIMSNYRNVFLYNEDGYKQALALSPPIVRRGLVLIDPSYEVKAEYLAAAEFVRTLHKKWPETVIMLWYPILQNGLHKVMSELLKSYELPKFLHQEIKFRQTKDANTMGSGLIICNLPYGSEKPVAEVAAWFK